MAIVLLAKFFGAAFGSRLLGDLAALTDAVFAGKMYHCQQTNWNKMASSTSRLELKDTPDEMLYKMSGGNPGACTVLLATMNICPVIDPENVFGPYSAILTLDKLHIYDSAIWILYKNICGGDFVMMLALLRAVQLGLAAKSELQEAIANEDMPAERRSELLAAVKERLPTFGQAVPAA